MVKLFQPNLEFSEHYLHVEIGERGSLVVNASDSGSRGRGFEPHSGKTVLCPFCLSFILSFILSFSFSLSYQCLND